MKTLINRNILKIKSYIPGKPIEEVKRELGIKGPIIKMASNENVLSPSKRIINAIKRNLRSLNRYPDGDCFYLKQAIANKFRLKFSNIIAGNGSDELIVLALRAFTQKGDEAIVAKPTFLIYEIASQVAGLKVQIVPLNNLRYDLKEMAKRLNKKTKIVFISNPDNPTGSYVTRSEVDSFLKKVGSNTIVFFDEAYYEFAKELKDYPDTLNYLKKKNVIITRTFSKIYSLAGLRIGYGFAEGDLVEAMNRVREPFNVNSLAQVAAIEALNDQDFVKRTLRLVRAGKEFLYNNLESLGYDYVKSATNFILINLKKDSKGIYQKLLRKGIIVREMSPWGLEGYVRVTVGRMVENKKFIKVLKEVAKR